MLRKMGLALAGLLAMTMVAPTAASAAPTACDTNWGRGLETVAPTTRGEVVGLSAGRHDCFDRLVFDVNAPTNGYWVSYVDEVTEDATGNPIPLRGESQLQITVHAPAYDENWVPTYTYEDRNELVDVSGFAAFRQVAWAGSWGGTTMVGLGVKHELPFRVFTQPGHIVIDVAHSGA